MSIHTLLLAHHIPPPRLQHGDHAYDPDMSVANDCYNMSIDAGTGPGPEGTSGPGWDCFREVFDPATGYARRPQ